MRAAGLSALLVLSLAGCAGSGDDGGPRVDDAPAAPPAPVVFTEVAAEVGLDFTHNTGAFGQKWLPETMGSGIFHFFMMISPSSPWSNPQA